MTSSAFVAQFYVRAENYRWLSGEDLISLYDAPILREPPAYRSAFCRRCGSSVPAVFAGNPVVGIPTGLVEGDISARAADHIWISQKANWLNLREIGRLPEHDGDPTEESTAHLFRPLNLE